jgi:NadR type nicotinamide-nucleotide adenylyltransferase
MITGFVIGKFYPFHLGHMYLLDVARARSDKLIVWVCEKADQEVLGNVRADWIKELYPDVEVRLVPDTLSDDDTAGWAKYTLRVLGKAPDIVFTSEDYGEPYARAMGSQHFLVNKQRDHVPISGTRVRADVFASWDLLAPPVRAYFAKRVVVLGAESTGTTTLAEALAGHYQTSWVPEYGRTYCEKKPDLATHEWSTNEFIHIASEQERREAEQARHAREVLICDTDAFATSIWHKRYMGELSPEVARVADKRIADLYILTGDEIPFVQDGTRDGEHIRHEMHEWFEQALKDSKRNYIVVRGTHDERMQQATGAIDALLSGRVFG